MLLFGKKYWKQVYELIWMHLKAKEYFEQKIETQTYTYTHAHRRIRNRRFMGFCHYHFCFVDYLFVYCFEWLWKSKNSQDTSSRKIYSLLCYHFFPLKECLRIKMAQKSVQNEKLVLNERFFVFQNALLHEKKLWKNVLPAQIFNCFVCFSFIGTFNDTL